MQIGIFISGNLFNAEQLFNIKPESGSLIFQEWLNTFLHDIYR